MYVIIVGGGKVGTHLAALLLEAGHEVRVIERGNARLKALHEILPGGTLIPGSGTDPATLEQAGVRDADVVAAVTGTDETNLVAMSLARFEYRVARTIARVKDPRNGWMFTPAMGVDVAVDQADIMAKLIAEHMSLGSMMTLLKLSRGDYSLVEQRVHEGKGSWTGAFRPNRAWRAYSAAAGSSSPTETPCCSPETRFWPWSMRPERPTLRRSWSDRKKPMPGQRKKLEKAGSELQDGVHGKCVPPGRFFNFRLA